MRFPDSVRLEAQRAFEAGASFASLSRRFRISPKTARIWATAGGWRRDGVTRRSPGPRQRDGQGRFTAETQAGTGPVRRRRRRPPKDTAAMLDGLRRAVARAVADAEERWAAPDSPPPGERDLRTLGALAAVLARLVALDPSRRTDRDGPSESDAPGHAGLDFDDPRQCAAFAARLERLAAGEEDDGAAVADGA
jgi:hypothetical protein